MWAVAQKHSAVVQVLLEHGDDVNARTHSSMQVINSAGNADPSGVYEIQAGGYTPLLFAARQGDVDSATLLLAAGADVNDAAPMGTSALVVAAHSGHGVLARLLLDKGADPNAAEAGYTALHAAVLRGDLRLVEALVTHGAGPNASLTRGTPARRVSRDWSLGHHLIGATPFWLAARFREPGIMRVLADHGADPLFVRDGMTAVMAALRGGSTRARFGVRPADQDEEERRTLDAVAVEPAWRVFSRTMIELGIPIPRIDPLSMAHSTPPHNPTWATATSTLFVAKGLSALSRFTVAATRLDRLCSVPTISASKGITLSQSTSTRPGWMIASPMSATSLFAPGDKTSCARTWEALRKK